ncbi:type VII secretion target [Actinoplanes sp. TRM 88003]|uniref:Type VII secretion target n=1 Tax=Paractinoplanes aksuensis TaxID=2939490 RepID=A0ABT1DPW4_9ACTN|nr:type VII secretion target [Actinoplanes aksuensis]MCO8272867.1 type VII secretion target [Actinoplanes aksuensis]
MSFHVEPADLRAYAAKLGNTHGDVADAKAYVQANGNFSFHEAGVIGLLFGGHRDFMAELQGMLDHLMQITETSQRALVKIADEYEDTDGASAARVDASYPAVPRPQITRD